MKSTSSRRHRTTRKIPNKNQIFGPEKTRAQVMAEIMAAPDLYLICQNPGAPPYGVRIAGRTYLGDIHTNVEAWHVWDDMGYLITDVKSLAGTAAPVRIAKLQADIYKKGEAEVSGFEPYITVNSMKGE